MTNEWHEIWTNALHYLTWSGGFGSPNHPLTGLWTGWHWQDEGVLQGASIHSGTWTIASVFFYVVVLGFSISFLVFAVRKIKSMFSSSS